jgi:hypothetical protein
MASSSTGELIKWGAIAVGGWYLYQKFFATPAAASATPSTGLTLADLQAAIASMTGSGGGSTPAGSSTPAAGSTTPPAPGSTAAALTTAAGGATSLTADQWNYYWSQISGQTQTVDLFPAGDRGALMSVTAYLAARTAAGLSAALPGLAGLGARALPIPLLFGYDGKGRPVMIVPKGAR